MRISEMFESVQGEGVHIGCGAFFVRLAGCNKDCEFCDTKYAKVGVATDPEEIASRIDSSPSKIVVFTGGEPLLQQTEIHKVINGVVSKKFYEVETNGTLDPLISGDINLFTVSPKDDFKISGKFFHLPNVVFKFVIRTESDLIKVQEFVCSHMVRDTVYLMPETVTLEGHRKILPMLFRFVQTYPTKYRITPRLQVLAFGKTRGV